MTDKICCNCQYYGGVKGALGHAPCELKNSITTWSETCESIWPIPLRLLIGTADNPETNADRIRAMSDEEMAEQLISGCPPCCFDKDGTLGPCPNERSPSKKDCKDCWLDWLKEEVSDEK